MQNEIAYLTDLKTIEIKSETVPALKGHEVLIRVRAIGVCGSDVAYYATGSSGMGMLNFPHVLGHEVAGDIVAVGEAVSDYQIGQRVAVEPGLPCGTCSYCLSGHYNLCENLSFMSTAVVRPYGRGGMAQYIIRPDRFLFELPPEVTYEQGAMMEPISVAKHAFDKSNLRPGDSAAILGCGPIAGCLLLVLKACGINCVYMTDVVDERTQRMKALGATEVWDTSKLDKENLQSLLPEKVNAVFDTTTNELAINASLHWLKKGGKLMIVGVPSGLKTLDMNTVFVNEIGIESSFRYVNTYSSVLNLTASGKLKPEKLVTHYFPLAQADAAMKLASEKRGDVMKIIIEP